ncbi:hypothetical protein EG329_002585 [Mollisiaceae sp. DMI_Dod_QoI]|nr:hypothetical protein EG329_002585 [Helotiales sp. DMI_Dod_QoI]
MEEHESPAPQPPSWFPFVLGLEFLLAVIILGLSAYIIHGKYFDTLGFTIFASLLTWLIVAYNFATVYITSLKRHHIQYAVMGADAVMFIFWLSAMGAAAALRASFKYSVTVDGCSNDGSLVNSETCVVERDNGGAVADSDGLAILSAIAGLSALEMLLFAGCLIVGVLAWNKTRSKSPDASYTPQKQEEGFQMEAPQPYVQVSQTGMHQQPQVQPYSHQSYAPQEQYVQTQNQTEYRPNMPTAC